MAYKTINHFTQVYDGITREQIEDALMRKAANPRLHHLRFLDLKRDYTRSSRTSSAFDGAVKRALLSYDHKQGVSALPKHATVYRVALHPDRNDIEVVSIGMERVDTTPDTVYTHFSYLPQWMQDRLHVMIMLDDTAPTEHIEGIGRRISKYVFWLEIPKGENNHG
tara:strand:+ start:1993 stop:2490 length:498 start_codon:yes stop_codon:yes gene_type:complete